MVNSEEAAPDAFVADCPSRQVLARLAEKWTMLTIAALSDGPLRFGELQRRVQNVSKKMLTQSLRKLAADGLIVRLVYDEMPLRVEYELTPLGVDLLPLIQAIKRWVESNLDRFANLED